MTTSEPQTRARLYLPTEVDDKIRRTVKARMADLAGGYTVVVARGGWVNDREKLVEEDVEILECVGMDQTAVQSTADWVAKRSDQDTVMWEVSTSTVGFEDGHEATDRDVRTAVREAD